MAKILRRSKRKRRGNVFPTRSSERPAKTKNGGIIVVGSNAKGEEGERGDSRPASSCWKLGAVFRASPDLESPSKMVLKDLCGDLVWKYGFFMPEVQK